MSKCHSFISEVTSLLNQIIVFEYQLSIKSHEWDGGRGLLNRKESLPSGLKDEVPLTEVENH